MFLLTMALGCLWSRSSGTDLHILGLFPITGEWDGGQSLLTAVQMAIDDINERDDILPGYHINLTYANTDCSAGQGIKMMTDNLYNGPTKIVIIGAACSTVSQATAQASHFWNLVQVSYGSSSPALSIKTRFPKFLRLTSSDSVVVPIRIRMFQELGWTRVATISQAYEVYTMVNDDLLLALDAANITLVTSQVFKTSPVQHVQRLKEMDARIIVGGMYPEQARPAFCESFKLGLIYPRVIWILLTWLNVGWWSEPDPSISCTREEMALAVEGVIYTGPIFFDPYNTITDSGLRPKEFQAKHRQLNGNKTLPGDSLASQGYDVMWTVALGLNATLTSLIESGSRKRLEDFTYSDSEFGDLIHRNMLNVTFQGMMGHVNFDKNGDPTTYVIIKQIQDGVRRDIGFGRIDQTGPLNLSLMRWKDDVPPRDGVRTYTKTLSLSPELAGFMCTLAAVGLIFSILFLIFNIYNRKIKFIKLSSPRLNNVVLIGCMVTYVTVFMSSLEPLQACLGRVYSSFIGWSLIFGALFSKTWRVHVIFTNVKLQKKVIKDTHLFLMVGCLTVFNLIVLLTWSIFDPVSIRFEQMYTESQADGDIVIHYTAAKCYSKYDVYFEGVLFAVQGIMLMFGAFLSWETRKVKVEALNDSKNIAVCIYNSAVLTLLYIIITLTMTLNPDLQYSFMATIFIIDATSVQFIIFIPKVLQYRQHRLHPDSDRGLTMGKEKTVSSSNEVPEDMENKLKQKEQEIAKLHDQIQQLNILVKEPCKENSADKTDTSNEEPKSGKQNESASANTV